MCRESSSGVKSHEGGQEKEAGGGSVGRGAVGVGVAAQSGGSQRAAGARIGISVFHEDVPELAWIMGAAFSPAFPRIGPSSLDLCAQADPCPTVGGA